jgi:Protein of unknown function (DUF3891)
MLIAARGETVQLVTQPDHARLTGTLAGAWAAEALSPSLVTVAARHDDGWAALDSAPVVLADAGRPAHFLEVPLEDTIAPYGQGIEGIWSDDPYAGVLASMHWAGLYCARFGVQDSPPLEHPLAREVVEREDERASRAARELWLRAAGLRSDLEAARWRDYEVLQALDFISLALCLIDTGTVSEPGEVPVAATLRGVEQPPSGRAVLAVPLGDARATLRVRVREPGVVALAPFPFAGDSLSVEVRARRMEPLHGAGEEAVRAAYHSAEPRPLELTLVAA